MKEFGFLNLLKPQLFMPQEEVDTIKNSMTLDWYFGHRDIISEFNNSFGHCKPWILKHCEYLSSISESRLELAANNARPNSLLMTPIMLTGECNAHCTICYTRGIKKNNELNWYEIKEIIDQTKALGSHTIYIAGEGEPTLDENIFRIFEYSKTVKMDVLFFTNGLLLSNDSLCKERWGFSSREFVNRISKSPVYVYFKFWSSDPEKTKELLNLDNSNKYSYSNFEFEDGRTILIPSGLNLLLQSLSHDRVGIEACVEKRTADDIESTLIPFIKQTGIRSYIEPLIHSGKNFNSNQFNPTRDQLHRLKSYLVRQDCTRVAYIFAVHNDGYATPGISILPEHLKLIDDYEALNIRDLNGTVKDLFTLRHSHPFLVTNRYKISGCLCEEFNIKMAELLNGTLHQSNNLKELYSVSK